MMGGKAPRPRSKRRETLKTSFTSLLAQGVQDKGEGCRDSTLPPAAHVFQKTLSGVLLCAERDKAGTKAHGSCITPILKLPTVCLGDTK